VSQVNPEQRAVALQRLRALREAGALGREQVRLVAGGLKVSERTVWRWLRETPVPADVSDGTAADGAGGAESIGPDRAANRAGSQRLSQTDRDAYVYFCGNVAAVLRARAAVVAGLAQAAGVPVPEFLVTGWAQAEPVAGRTLYRAFEQQLTPGERAAWTEGEQARRDGDVYLRRPAGHRNQWWELDNKQLPILVLPPRGPALCPRGWSRSSTTPPAPSWAGPS
jgi:putative transposase